MFRPRFQRGPCDTLETLHPAYFALVMATGIVAIAAHLQGHERLGTLLFWLNAAFFVGLTLATILRIIRYPSRLLADVANHSRGVGFFTVVAATGTFGTQLILQRQAAGLATIFWATAAALWVAITYGVLAVLTVKREKPGLVDGFNGGWLVIVVATQSVSILSTLIAQKLAVDLQPLLAFAALVLWLGAGALYMWLMTLVFYRYTFERMSPADLTPPYWINMGAMAISTLAGATLLEHAALSPLVAELIPFIKGVTLFFWAVASWWIPMLLLLGIWRYLIRGMPFAYDPLYWGGVFPLGMYSVATLRLSQTLHAPFLFPLSEAFMVIAILVWTVTLFGMVDSLIFALRRSRSVS